MRIGKKAVFGMAAVAVAAGCFAANRVLRRDGDTADPVKGVAGPVTRPVAVETVTRLAQSSPLTYPGTVRAARTARLSFRVGGPILEFPVKPGDIVREQEILVRLDPRDYENEVLAIQARLEAAAARLEEEKAGAREEDIRAMEARLDAARARAVNAELDHARAEELLRQGVMPKADFDRADSALAVARASVRDQEESLAAERAGARSEEVRALEAEIRGMEVALATARNHVSDTILRAPFDGVVTKQFAEAHEMVAPGTPVISMHDISELEIMVDVPESELIHRSPHDTYATTVTFSAIPGRVFRAAVKEWDTEANPLTRTYAVTLAMEAPEDITVLPGMTAEVSARLQDDASAESAPIAIPAGAVVPNSDGQDTVWVLPPGARTAELRHIWTGAPCAPDKVTVLDGLTVGERIVTAGARYVVPDMPLRAVAR